MPAITPNEAQDAPALTKAANAPFSLRYAWYVVGVLTLLYAFSFIDRQIFSLLVARFVATYASATRGSVC
jgi:hypothetical protein